MYVAFLTAYDTATGELMMLQTLNVIFRSVYQFFRTNHRRILFKVDTYVSKIAVSIKITFKRIISKKRYLI